MKYLCLVYIQERRLEALSRKDLDTLAAETAAYDEELRSSGHYVVSTALQPVQTATTLRMRRGRLSIDDGPYAETREQLGNCVLIEARDLNEALHVAAKIPPGRLGSIEVRPVREPPGSTTDRRMP